MLQTVRITSKRQITIPARVFESLNFAKGDRLVVEISDDKLVMQKAQAVLDSLAGSLRLPKKYKGVSMKRIIGRAKREYFQKKQ